MPHVRTDSLSPTRETIEDLPCVHDVIIVGAGPCGLAVAARLREDTPSALFTDEEHNRYLWINKHGARASIKSSRTGHVRGCRASKCGKAECSLLVLDSSGATWMAKWNRLFAQLEIKHLRSPMFFHPDPHDRDGLLAYAHEVGREQECLEIAGCVGKEISKHKIKKRRSQRSPEAQAKATITIDERDRKDYFCPPSDLFKEYCKDIARRYNLMDQDLVKKATIVDIEYDFVPHLSDTEKLFTIKSDGPNYFARNVVLAVGAGNGPSIPKPFDQSSCPNACHAFQPSDQVLKERLKDEKSTSVLVIGGGLTSAQVADRAIRQGATKVYHLLRGPAKVKPFDVDLDWMGKFRNHEKASFWSADTDEERSELVKLARGGGSITPRFMKILEQHIKAGKLSLHTETVVELAHFNPLSKTWRIVTQPPIENLPQINFVYFATGVQSDIEKLPYLQNMVQKFSIATHDGMPALTDDLQWHPDIPLFVTGKFAALRLGPGAGNLEGARLGAERIAWALQDVLTKTDASQEEDAEGADIKRDASRRRYAAGIGNRFELLEIV